MKRGVIMREEYDITNSVKNPYAKRVKKQVTMNLDNTVVTYFKDLAIKTGIPYQTLINMYLSYCAEHKLQLQTMWKEKTAV